jgi:hypothetical protein
VPSSRERRIRDDVERIYATEAEEPVPPGSGSPYRRRLGSRGVDDLPGPLVAGLRATILLVISEPTGTCRRRR